MVAHREVGDVRGDAEDSLWVLVEVGVRGVLRVQLRQRIEGATAKALERGCPAARVPDPPSEEGNVARASSRVVAVGPGPMTEADVPEAAASANGASKPTRTGTEKPWLR